MTGPRARMLRRALLGCFAALLVGAPGALATSSLTPNTAQDFGSVNVGAASAPKVINVQVSCTSTLMGVCVVPGFQPVAVSTTTDFSATTTCAAVVAHAVATGSTTCPVNVTFSPSAPGPRNGVLTVGAGLPTVNLSGNGVAVPVAKKKCKKKGRSASAAKKKKCKKKKK